MRHTLYTKSGWIGGDYMAIYLDTAASTKVKPNILAKFVESAETYYANPSSQHHEGRISKKHIEEVKENIAKKIYCDSQDIFFTMGATMSNQLLIQGFIAKHPDAMVITTNVEHNDIMMLVNNLLIYRYILTVGKDGLIKLDKLEEILRYVSEDMHVPTLLSIQMANSETGIIQPIHKICEISHKYENVFLHMDATQYIPYFPINMECWGVDSISMSGQKIGGLKGSGLLVVREKLRNNIKPIIYGEQGLIGGTPSTPLIISLGEAFNELEYDNSSIVNKRNKLLSHIQDMGGILVGDLDNRLPNNIYVRFPGINGLTLLYLLDEYGIYIGTGSACSTDSDKPSHVAKAYGLTDEEAFECVRFTLSDEISDEDIEFVVKVLRGVFPLITKS